MPFAPSHKCQDLASSRRNGRHGAWHASTYDLARLWRRVLQSFLFWLAPVFQIRARMVTNDNAYCECSVWATKTITGRKKKTYTKQRFISSREATRLRGASSFARWRRCRNEECVVLVNEYVELYLRLWRKPSLVRIPCAFPPCWCYLSSGSLLRRLRAQPASHSEGRQTPTISAM